MDKDTAEKLIPNPLTEAIISITGTDDDIAKLHPTWKYRLNIQADDLEGPMNNDEEEISYLEELYKHCYFKKIHADAINNFISMILDSGVQTLYIHCLMGISRSASVAKYVAERFNLEFPENYSFHNRRIFRLLIESYDQFTDYGTFRLG
ncbi:MAG: dual specificity protein phosphatase family protein [Nitrospirae bacterium]|nr:dual specificity protein phosphatase family protein [Nitrospirota bacterium]